MTSFDGYDVFCSCRKRDDGSFMIRCDHCSEWYHGTCVGISVAVGRRMERRGEDFVCRRCRKMKLLSYGMVGVILLVFASLFTPFWLRYDSTRFFSEKSTQIGLWYHCSDDTCEVNSEIPVWIQISRQLLLSSAELSAIATVLAVLYCQRFDASRPFSTWRAWIRTIGVYAIIAMLDRVVDSRIAVLAVGLVVCRTRRYAWLTLMEVCFFVVGLTSLAGPHVAAVVFTLYRAHSPLCCHSARSTVQVVSVLASLAGLTSLTGVVAFVLGANSDGFFCEQFGWSCWGTVACSTLTICIAGFSKAIV